MTVSKKRLTGILWFVAAALGFIAIVIRYVSDREMNYATFAFSLFCLIMGIVSLRMSTPPSTG